MDPQTFIVLGKLAAYGPGAAVVGLLIMNLHRFTDAYEAVSATRLRNKAARQTLNCELSESQRDHAVVVFKGLARSRRAGDDEVAPLDRADASPAKTATRVRRKKPS